MAVTPPSSSSRRAPDAGKADGQETPSPTTLAKAALARLVRERQEPTPENYAKAYAAESGVAPAEPPVDPLSQPGFKRMLDRLAEWGLAQADASQRQALVQALRQQDWDSAQRLVQACQPPSLAEQAESWSDQLQRMVGSLDRGGRQWTGARKRESLQRLLSGSRVDPNLLLQRLKQLVTSWDDDRADEPVVEAGAELSPGETSPSLAAVSTTVPTSVQAAAPSGLSPSSVDVATMSPPSQGHPSGGLDQDPEALSQWLEGQLEQAVTPWRERGAQMLGCIQSGLPPVPDLALLKSELGQLHGRLHTVPMEPGLLEAGGACDDLVRQAQRALAHRSELQSQLNGLCGELTASLKLLVEDESWVQGQCQQMGEKVAEGLNGRGVRAVSQMLRETLARQTVLKAEREQARAALKGLIARMLADIGQLGEHTGHFNDEVQHFAQAIAGAESLDRLAEVVRHMVEESRTVHDWVDATRARLQADQSQAQALSDRVRELETELKRLSDEVSTDPLTEVANRRGLIQAFATEQARVERQDAQLSIGLLDIDNFKKLNDTLGHQTGDEALKYLSSTVRLALRQQDTLARYGGEEFVVLMPDTPIDEAQQALTRLQRQLTEQFFMHEDKKVFVTFSAGVTLFRPGETLEVCLDRADVGLYEAKRTGKNRTCVA
ncbi:MAG: GGDEF domain-containing protein [Burkholderiaceae bacterium]|nr:MAG: GGDEF domain-containing protein [Burkholderiaceae bacterium]